MAQLDQRNRRVIDEHYALVPKYDIPRSTFRRVHELKTTGPSGYLIPILVDEVLPGDVHSGKVTVFARLATLLFPLMDNASLETQFFFVASRLLWTNWTKFMGEQDNPGDSISYLIPVFGQNGTTDAFSLFNPNLMLMDYMGVPLCNATTAALNVNALPFRAYNKIYNQWYRDQNLSPMRPERTGDTGDIITDYEMMRRSKKHDAFTSALPWPQKGNAVTLPMGGFAPIKGIGTDGTTAPSAGTSYLETDNTTAVPYPYMLPGNTNAFKIRMHSNSAADGPAIYADLSQATSITVNALRLAVQTQKLLERDARGGTRYTEGLQAHWGVDPQDSRLNRPEYIGGGTSNIQTAAIAQTAPTPNDDTSFSDTPFGGLSGQATATGQHSYTLVAQEHGYIIGLASLMTRPTYQEGLHRLYTRSTRYDFPWPEFAALGEQAIRNDEIYAQGTAADAQAFGYQERYYEMRFSNNRVSGLFRTKNTGSITQWHLAQSFDNLPTLGDTFIKEHAPWDRVLAAGNLARAQEFLADFMFEVKTTRALPAYGVPGSLQGTF